MGLISGTIEDLFSHGRPAPFIDQDDVNPRGVSPDISFCPYIPLGWVFEHDHFRLLSGLVKERSSHITILLQRMLQVEIYRGGIEVKANG